MARAESKMIMGYLPIEEPALLSLVQPANPAVRLLDPFWHYVQLSRNWCVNVFASHASYSSGDQPAISTNSWYSSERVNAR